MNESKFSILVVILLSVIMLEIVSNLRSICCNILIYFDITFINKKSPLNSITGPIYIVYLFKSEFETNLTLQS